MDLSGVGQIVDLPSQLLGYWEGPKYIDGAVPKFCYLSTGPFQTNTHDEGNVYVPGATL